MSPLGTSPVVVSVAPLSGKLRQVTNDFYVVK